MTKQAIRSGTEADGLFISGIDCELSGFKKLPRH
jgi:hypothetical protein